jgi:hypothetical protein
MLNNEDKNDSIAYLLISSEEIAALEAILLSIMNTNIVFDIL